MMTGQLAGKRVLVVEDEYFVATDLQRALQKEGACVVGPAGDLARGMALLDGEPVDAAVLDVNLEGSVSLPIADELSQRSVPYLFLTGYDAHALPEAYRAVPRVLKPFDMRRVVAQVGLLIGLETAA